MTLAVSKFSKLFQIHTSKSELDSKVLKTASDQQTSDFSKFLE